MYNRHTTWPLVIPRKNGTGLGNWYARDMLQQSLLLIAIPFGFLKTNRSHSVSTALARNSHLQIISGFGRCRPASCCMRHLRQQVWECLQGTVRKGPCSSLSWIICLMAVSCLSDVWESRCHEKHETSSELGSNLFDADSILQKVLANFLESRRSSIQWHGRSEASLLFPGPIPQPVRTALCSQV